MKGIRLRVQKIITYDFFHDPMYFKLKRIMKERESELVDIIRFLGNIIEKHDHYYKYPSHNVLFKSIFSDGRHISKWHCAVTDVMALSEELCNMVEPIQRAWQANDRKL
jgi:hypothetical protein